MKTLFVLLLMTLGLAAHEHHPAAAMAQAASTFMATLSDEQKALAVFEFADEERENWHFVPMNRKGIRLDALSSHQQALAHALFSTALSAKGQLTASTIMNLEQVLRDYGADPNFRDPGKYFLAVFGTPSADGSWGWCLEGHHLSLNLTVVNGALVVPTPHFFGSNPSEVRDGKLKGTRLLGSIEDAARELARELHRAGKHVRYTEQAPSDIITGQDRIAKPLNKEGVVSSEMSDGQKEKLLALVQEVAAFHRKEILSVAKDELKETYFAWAGEFDAGNAHYFFIQTPRFLIEYANTQNEANHSHLVWRNFDGDFGRDVLREHLSEGH